MSKAIKHLRMCCQPVIPLTYDDSLSYMETLYKVIHKVNELIEYTEGILETAEDYTDAQIAELKASVQAQIDAINADMESFKNEIYNYVNSKQAEFENDMLQMFEAQKNEIDREFSTLTESVNNLITAISNSVDTLKTYVDSQDEDIRNSIRRYHGIAIEYIDSQVQLLEDEIQAIVLESVTKVIDPCDCEIKGLQATIDNMYYNLRSWAFTARQYDMLGLTAGEYDSLNGCAWTYDYLGKWVWWQKRELLKYVDAMWKRTEEALEKVYKLIDERTITHSAWKGSNDKIIHILDSAIQEIRDDAITAELYDALLLTCTDYNSYELTAYMYDWHALRYLLAPDESEFSRYAQLEYETAYATNNLLDLITKSVDNVTVENGQITIETSDFDGEPYDVQGIISDTVPRLGYQVYENIIAVNKIIEKLHYQFKLEDDTLTIEPIGIDPIPETASVAFSIIIGQITRLRNALRDLNDYYTYVMSVSDEIFEITGTQLVTNM